MAGEVFVTLALLCSTPASVLRLPDSGQSQSTTLGSFPRHPPCKAHLAHWGLCPFQRGSWLESRKRTLKNRLGEVKSTQKGKNLAKVSGVTLPSEDKAPRRKGVKHWSSGWWSPWQGLLSAGSAPSPLGWVVHSLVVRSFWCCWGRGWRRGLAECPAQLVRLYTSYRFRVYEFG